MILALRTDNPQAEIYLYGPNKEPLEKFSWKADRELSTTLHENIYTLLKKQLADWQDISGVIFYEGPGSFTGLRIGASLANTLASELKILAVQAGGNQWIEKGINELNSKSSRKPIVPNYGREPRITSPRK